MFYTYCITGITHVCSKVRALCVVYDQDVLGPGHLVLGPGAGGDVEDAAVFVPHDPGSGLPRHHAGQLGLKPTATLQCVLLS